MPEKTKSRVPQMKRRSTDDSLTAKGAPTGAIPPKLIPEAGKAAPGKPKKAIAKKASQAKSARTRRAKEAAKLPGRTDARSRSGGRGPSPLREFLDDPMSSMFVTTGVEMVVGAINRLADAKREERRVAREREDAREGRLYDLITALALRTACPANVSPASPPPAAAAPATEG